MSGGPWMIGGRTYHEWSRVPLWAKRQIRSRGRRARARDRYDGLLEGSSGWRRTAFGLAVGSAVALGIAELLWKL
jgi:hypothetical protein